MSRIILHFDLLPNKYTEFMYSWQTFIDHVQTNEGFESFDLKQTNLQCDIILNWKSKESLILFMGTKWYSFINGAISVLGSNSSSVIE